jgi:hypothetical protein
LKGIGRYTLGSKARHNSENESSNSHGVGCKRQDTKV